MSGSSDTIWFFLSIISGFGLYAWESRIPAWRTLFGWTYGVLPVAQLRLVHFMLMFRFAAFTRRGTVEIGIGNIIRSDDGLGVHVRTSPPGPGTLRSGRHADRKAEPPA